MLESQTAKPSEVYFMASDDGGATWSQPSNITDDDPSEGFNQYQPGVSVAPGGRVDVAWYDFRNDPFFSPGESGGMGTSADERFWDVYYTTSDDGGRSWSTNTRVTNPSVDGRLGVTFNNNDVRGPMGIASTADAAYLAWSDSRATGPQAQEAEDAYLSRVRFAAPGPLGGDEGGSEVWWAALVAAGALVVGGLALAAAARRPRRQTATA
ncbi:MAG: glycoside hydrolase [Actinomycetota bacterium]|nr:glycoside hydrolase [Actinomycetota bacterium]